MRKLVGRNVDRECDRADIEESVWIEFLLEVAQHIVPDDQIRSRAYSLWCDRGKSGGSPEADWYRAERELYERLILDPLNLMDFIVEKRRHIYALRGAELPMATCPRVYRYVEISSFWMHNLWKMPFAPLVHHLGANDLGLQKIAALINGGTIVPSSIVGTSLGNPGYPVWCTDRSLRGGATGDRIRDALGLKHVEGGFLVEVAYPIDSLCNRGESLRAPTVLDASASGPKNWIFLKNRAHGGPDWGYTAHVTASGILEQGPPEAVHRHFRIEVADAAQMTLSAIGPITGTPPHVDFERSFDNDNA